MKKNSKKNTKQVKKNYSPLIIIISALILLVVLDLASIVSRDKPVFAIKGESDNVNSLYKGLLYDTYYCFDEDKVHVVSKFTDYECEKTDSDFALVGKIKAIKDDYISVLGISDDNYLKYGLEAHVSLSNNPEIKGAEKLKVDQFIKLRIVSANEIYPPQITTEEIEVISNAQSSSSFTIVDKTKTMKDFSCADALEKIYEDDQYKYYLTCLKSDYVVVQHDDGSEESLMSALNMGIVSIGDAMKMVDIVKEENIDYQMNVTKSASCAKEPVLYKTENDYSIYTYCLDSIKITYRELSKELKDLDIAFNKILLSLLDNETFKPNDVLQYDDGGSNSFTNKEFTILACNTLNGNKNVYVGPAKFSIKNNFCSNK